MRISDWSSDVCSSDLITREYCITHYYRVLYAAGKAEQMRKIHVIHENEAWLPPLREALQARGLPYAEWHMAGGAIDLDAPPPEGVFDNRLRSDQTRVGNDWGSKVRSRWQPCHK